MREEGFPTQAIILAAGRGARFRPLTDNIPKPLVPLQGKPLIDWQLEMLARAGIKRVVVNCCYLKEALMAYVRGRNYGIDEIIFSEEETALETGGGIKKALPFFEGNPFFAVNADVVMLGEAMLLLMQLARALSLVPSMQAALLLQPRVGIIGLHSAGDFFCDTQGRMARRGGEKEAPFTFTGVQLLRPQAFEDIEASIFSMNKVYDALLEQASHALVGIVNQQGMMLHVGDMEGYREAEDYLEKEYTQVSHA